MNITGLFQAFSLGLTAEGYLNILYWWRIEHPRKKAMQIGRFVRGTIGLIATILLQFAEVILNL